MFPFLSDYLFHVFGLCTSDLVCNCSHFLSTTQNIPNVKKIEHFFVVVVVVVVVRQQC